MDQLKSASETFDNIASGWLSHIDNNEYVSAALSLFLIVYASYAAPRLPEYILRLFDYALFKVLIFFLIVYSARKNPTVAIIAAVGLMVTLVALNKLKIDKALMTLVGRENMSNIQKAGMIHGGEEMVVPEASLHEAEVTGIAEEVNDKCVRTANFRDSFYPQYVDMKSDAYDARYTGKDVSAFDPNATYSSI